MERLPPSPPTIKYCKDSTWQWCLIFDAPAVLRGIGERGALRGLTRRTKPGHRGVTIGEKLNLELRRFGERRKLSSDAERNGLACDDRNFHPADICGVPRDKANKLTQVSHRRCGLRSGEIAQAVQSRAKQGID